MTQSTTLADGDAGLRLRWDPTGEAYLSCGKKERKKERQKERKKERMDLRGTGRWAMHLGRVEDLITFKAKLPCVSFMGCSCWITGHHCCDLLSNSLVPSIQGAMTRHTGMSIPESAAAEITGPHSPVSTSSFSVHLLPPRPPPPLLSSMPLRDGSLFDCDFNQQLALSPPAESAGGPSARHVSQLSALEGLVGCTVATAKHCFG